MKVVLYRRFGGFHYPEKFCKQYNVEPYDWVNYDEDDEYRFHDTLINWVEENPQDSEGLCVVDIPDDVTDWQIHDYDGLESILCVINGKIVWL